MDYKDTLNLPKTNLPMKANLSLMEPTIIEKWEREDLYGNILKTRKGSPKYILHDGPPYANGPIHIGHALNKILKDIVCKAKTMSGYYSKFVPGWDCHGLPIELEVDKALGGKKNDISRVEIRRKCREYAERYVNLQREEFKRLGVFGQWTMPYLTMSYEYEATILKELGRFVEKGLVYRGLRPVHWCVSCRTALAEAEVEYAKKVSPSIYVRFKVSHIGQKILDDLLSWVPQLRISDLYFIIWTTTPWTLPANLALAVHPDVEYSLIESQGDYYIVASKLVEKLVELIGLEGKKVKSLMGKELEGIKAIHPFLERDSIVITGDFVTTEEGTGIVHIAPGHGEDDYIAGLKYGLNIFAPVDDSGRFTKDVPEWEGVFVFDANPMINKRLREVGALIAEERLEHSYPHCWRCKKPVIFRATEQWFISLDKDGLRNRALREIDKVTWIPSWGRERISNMILHRPDWCISRQRAWGVPIVAFYCKSCGFCLINNTIIDRVVEIFKKGGADEWFIRSSRELLPSETRCPQCGGDDFEKEEDILDVWFDSGVSYAAVLEKDAELGYPSDLYLEGSDQHRGWFHSSLLASVGTKDRAPYKGVLTHGFVVDGEGRKMSKSMGNVISPQEVIKKHGAEILRLWVSAEDYREDMRLSNEILSRLIEAYRRIRNTCRFMLGNLYDFDPVKDALPYNELKEMDRWALSRLGNLINKVTLSYERFEFHTIYHSIHNFCVVDMSNFYLDALKDRLYTSKRNGKGRRSAQTVIFELLNSITRLIAPILPFTAEEVWGYIPQFPSKEVSVHLSLFPKVKEEWLNKEVVGRWERLLGIRKDVTKALEVARKKGIIGSSLDARVSIAPNDGVKGTFKDFIPILREVFIVSQVEIGSIDGMRVVIDGESVSGIKIGVDRATGRKCERCWNYSPKVGAFKAHPGVCERCIEVLIDCRL